MGYVGLSVVFSFALTCCLQNDFKPEWAKWIRPWALISWSFLTLGIALGSWWAHQLPNAIPKVKKLQEISAHGLIHFAHSGLKSFCKQHVRAKLNTTDNPTYPI